MPIAINNTDITTETTPANIILILKLNPKTIASTKNNIFCIKIIGISDNIYPIMYSIDFIGLTPNLINNDVVLSFEISIAVNKVIMVV